MSVYKYRISKLINKCNLRINFIYRKCDLFCVLGALFLLSHPGRYGRYGLQNLVNEAFPNDSNMRTGTTRPLHRRPFFLVVCAELDIDLCNYNTRRNCPKKGKMACDQVY
jgi:hypothetical protein